MYSKKLIILCSGPTTISRRAHLEKLTKISMGLFNRTIIITEDIGVIILNRFQYFMSEKYALSKWSSKILSTEFLRRKIIKFKELYKHLSKGDVVIVLGIYQPISLMTILFKGAFSIIFVGGLDVNRGIVKNRVLDHLFFLLRWSLQIFNLHLAKRLILESLSVKKWLNLEKFVGKIRYAPFFIPETFRKEKTLSYREIDVAFIGALAIEKGIIHFLRALQIVLMQRKIKALVCGDGDLRRYIENSFLKSELNKHVVFKQYVNFADIPSLLNEIKLLVLPSKSEGLPNLVIEAMACGTPVLATSVGGIPDVIKEGETGFLLNNIDPKHIARRIIQLLNNHEILEKISSNAYSFVKENFNYDKIRQTWIKLINELNSDYRVNQFLRIYLE